MKLTILLLLPLTSCWAAAYTANQNANWHTATDFTPNGVPTFGDTITDNQYTLTCEAGQTCDIGTVNSTAITIGDGTHAASLIINGTLVLRGQGSLNGPVRDCINSPGVTLGTGSTLQLDENSGTAASGFVTPAGAYPCVRFTMGSSGDVCAWGTSSPTCPTNVSSINNGSGNGILLLDSAAGYGDSITNWNGVGIANCGTASTSVAGCYQQEMFTSQSSWAWNQVYLNGDAAFGANATVSVGSNSTSITINNAISGGARIQGTDIYFGSECSAGAYSPSFVPACTGARSVTNSLLRDMNYDGVHSDSFTAGATISNVYWDGLGSYYPVLTAANVAGGSWSYVAAVSDASTCAEDNGTYTSILAPTADHVYALCTSASGVPLLLVQPSSKNWGTNISLSNAIFDLEYSSSGGGHCYLYGTDGASDSGYSATMSYITVLRNPALGYGCGFTQWSSVCPASPTASITHLLSPGGTNIGPWYACEGSSSVATSPALSVYRGNIFYDSSARVNPLMFGNSNAANQPANVVPPTGIDYNLNYNFVPFVTTPYTTACAPGCTNSGSPYAVPMTNAAPGPHDLPPGSPRLLDNTRNAYAWANAIHGQAATAAGFKQVFINGGPSAVGANIAALFYYVNQGNIPARSLWNVMPDGTTIGPSQPVMFPGNIRTVTQ